jgi:arylsulfatase A-like enzyme
MHRDDGMLIVNGPGIRQGSEIEGAVIHDIAPTVLHTMGLAVPADMDGQMLEAAFSEGYMDHFPLQLGAPPPTPTHADGGDSEGAYTEEGEREILERLEGLGYLG